MRGKDPVGGHGGVESAPPTVPPTRRSRYDLRKRDSGGSLESSTPSEPTVVRSPPHRTVPSNRRNRSHLTRCAVVRSPHRRRGPRRNSVVVSHHHRRHPQWGCRFGTPVHLGEGRGSGVHGDAHPSTVRLIGVVVKRQIACPARASATFGDSPRQPWTTNDNQQLSPTRRRISMRPGHQRFGIERIRRPASIGFHL